MTQQAVVWPDELDDPAGDGPDPAAPGRGRRPTGRRNRRRLHLLACVAGAAVLLAQGVWLVGVVRRAESVQDPLATGETPFVDEAVAPPPADHVPSGSAGAGARSEGASRVRSWADGLAPRVQVPPVALAAYGAAELRLAVEDPGCHLSWVALAGIGRIESDHGRFRGAVLGEDGRSTPPVVGVPLDGNGVAAIGDTDGGALDGDAAHDRAVGPMQFIPSTWRRWGADGDGDGVADPNVLPDAALAAGRYLCAAGGGDLRTGRAWTRAVLAYNNSGDYLARVTAAANGYVTAAR